jgi:hypothetical protein
MSNAKRNYLNYIQGKEPLEHVTIPMGDHDDMFDFIKKSVKRDLWVLPFKNWQDFQVLKNNKKK